ncbi:hypothetical protein YSA_04771 [Pseudomonas putida ND6]|uniref:Uncharacterized protein n=1 Tax=Pseudomonas putida ND6 TaxID=231023 RepID=I3UV31_PSEPU|nr:hypothetical protein YSA_04771 [Pseudomonas putida ND6]
MKIGQSQALFRPLNRLVEVVLPVAVTAYLDWQIVLGVNFWGDGANGSVEQLVNVLVSVRATGSRE